MCGRIMIMKFITMMIMIIITYPRLLIMKGRKRIKEIRASNNLICH